jgi:hypothetical protein
MFPLHSAVELAFNIAPISDGNGLKGLGLTGPVTAFDHVLASNITRYTWNKQVKAMSNRTNFARHPSLGPQPHIYEPKLYG